MGNSLIVSGSVRLALALPLDDIEGQEGCVCVLLNPNSQVKFVTEAEI